MEDQIVSAIQFAWDPAADQTVKREAFTFVNQLRQEAAAWQPCINIFCHTPRHIEVVRVFALEVVNNAIQTGVINPAALRLVRDQLLAYLQKEYGPQTETRQGAPDPPNIENKIAQTVMYLFCNLYEFGWESCFDDLLGLTSVGGAQNDNLLGVVFYLRVVNDIHDEIGDVLVSRSREEQDRANKLKDLIRARDVRRIVQSWQEILGHWRVTNGTVGELSMRVIGKWVSWIDISLIVNQEMLQLVLLQLEQSQGGELGWEREKARDSAVDVFTEIVSKKMAASDKVNMISFISLQAVIDKVSSWAILADSKKPIYDVDLAENVARLVNATVIDIVRALETEQQSSETWRKAEQMLKSFLPHLLKYFSDEYDDVCQHVLPAMTDVLAFLRRAFQGDEFASQRATMLIPILTAIFLKSRVDPASDIEGEYDGENTEEAEFIELRKRLSSLQQSIAVADEQLFVDAASALINDTFEKLQAHGNQLDWRDLDLALHEMYLLGDLAVKSGGLYQKNKPNSPAAERLVRMMLMMIQSGTGSYGQPGIQVQYMEICVRYSSFFEKHSEHVPSVLQHFLQFAHSSNQRVKLRSWYLLHRFVRQQRHNVGPAADVIIPSLQDLLAIRAEIPADNEGDSSDDEMIDSTFTSQLYLFEAIGCIISTNNVAIDHQISYAEAVMQPIFSDIQANLQIAKSNKQACLQVHHDIMALGNIARGYFDWTGANPSAAGVSAPGAVKEAFARVAEVTLVALETLKSSFDIRTAARFTFSRLIGMVGSQMISQLPRWVDGFLTETTSKDEMAQFLRVLDQVTFGFKNDIFAFLDTLFASLLRRVFAGISDTATGTDDEIQQAELKREYLNFLLVVLGNDLGGVLVSEMNQPHFETVIGTIEHLSKDISDLTTAKMAFQVMSKMASVWGGADVVAGQTINESTSAAQELTGFKHFMIQRFSPLCWAMPANSSFNPKDGQSRQVLMEAGGLQKMLYAKNGQDYITYLRTSELPGIGLQGQMLEEYLSKFTSSDYKTWRSWFAKFVSSGGAT